MSAGQFINAKYSSLSTGLIHRIRIQPETQALVLDGTNNAGPGADVNSPIAVQVTNTRRSLGITPRTITVRFTTTLPTGYKPDQLYRLVILTNSLWQDTAIGATGTYLGQPIEVVSKSPESSR